MLNNLKIGPKLTGGFIIVSLIAAIVGIIGLVNIIEIGVNRLPGVKALNTIQIDQNKVFSGERGLLIPIIFNDETTRKAQYKWMDDALERAGEMAAAYSRLPKRREEVELWKKFQVQWDEWMKKHNEFMDATRNKEAEMRKKVVNEEQVNMYSGQMDNMSLEARATFLAANESLDKLVAINTSIAQKAAMNAKVIMIALIIIGTLFAFFIGIILTRSITRPLSEVVEAIQKVGKGYLDINLTTDRGDELGTLAKAMKTMVDKLEEIILFAFHASENVSAGSNQLSSSAQGISQGSTEQASAVEEISSSIEEMSSSINQNADNANQTEKIAMKSSADAKEGGEAVLRTVNAMKQIAEKISIIQEIARQTNLLSLNASIEAARAGEHGKGFAVVASAVQKLAERSQDAAEEISKLSKSSVEVAETAGDMLGKIVPDIHKTAELVAEINAASAEQNKSAQQVNSAIQQFNAVVQSNVAASEQLAATSEELSSQAAELKGRLSFFRVDNRSYPETSPASMQRVFPRNQTTATVQSGRPQAKPNDGFSNKAERSDGGVVIDMGMGDEDDANFKRI